MNRSIEDVSWGTGPEAANPLGAPSGFNYTKHNCNGASKRRRTVGRCCGKLTLIGNVDGKYKHHRFRCKAYACAICGPRKIRLVRKGVVRCAVEHRLHRFLTLTLDPKKFRRRLSLQEKIKYLHLAWRKMRVSFQRRLGKSLVFIAVLELQKNGNPHLHALVGSYLPKEWISAAWQAVGGGSFTRIQHVDVHRVAAYLSKYFTDESTCDLPPGTRRYSTSRGLALFDRSKSSGVWMLAQIPIDFWREHSDGVTAEQFEADPKGVRILVRFVALRVSIVLAVRLCAADSPPLWIEVRRNRSVRRGCWAGQERSSRAIKSNGLWAEGAVR